jgi:hypothetical protein
VRIGRVIVLVEAAYQLALEEALAGCDAPIIPMALVYWDGGPFRHSHLAGEANLRLETIAKVLQAFPEHYSDTWRGLVVHDGVRAHLFDGSDWTLEEATKLLGLRLRGTVAEVDLVHAAGH